MIAPYLPYAFGLVEYRYGYSLMEISNPFKTLDMLSNGQSQQADTVITLLAIVAGFAIVLNLRSMWTGVMELVKYQPKSTSKPTPPAEQTTLEEKAPDA